MKEYLIAFAKNLGAVFMFFAVVLAITFVFIKYGFAAALVCFIIVIVALKSYLDVNW